MEIFGAFYGTVEKDGAKVEEGDLSRCDHLPYVKILKAYPHYNRRDFDYFDRREEYDPFVSILGEPNYTEY